MSDASSEASPPAPPATLADWLAHCERLHPSTIDLTLERVAAVARRLDLRFECPVFTVAGTNGKGSTCAMLEAILQQSGYRTGVYTSPHLVHFEERCRINAEVVKAGLLLPHFAAVEQAREGAQLTYFEFTTLAILRLLSQCGLDAVVLEVGLGGRLDAVNVIDTDCAILTSIDLDHMDFLGPDRESIGREKAGIMRPGRPVVVSDPVPPQSVLSHAEAIGADLWRFGQDYNYAGQQGSGGNWQQWSWAGRSKRYTGLAYPALRGANQLINASGVLAALEALRERLPVTAQAVRTGLALVELPGRFQIVPGQPTLVLDVAHNPHAVATLAQNLDQMGYYPRTLAVFGAMADKDSGGILQRLLPMVDNWYFTDLPTARASSAAELMQRWQALPKTGAGAAQKATASCHVDPMSALQAALGEADPTDRIVVFGSFYTVGGVLQNGTPRLAAKHLG
ncbi:bifunctional tetrahydrofolate synthase/dihydrofolate synthase [Aquabacterium sp. A7-Y]|uniref:bifunctional tetrahydrofolate synthase/dihydrofolate synthase n=1 Tax=Aquabacterium sp. A7-Y TaxID=1349605 RepID=UPI00223E231E|nr:bifunctional tetrahydrofolate synthase/dihydrofolate synthase [Aquabacterium sp. A7-Y]MCW7538276.1 bifunctional tetrahydrofolate synthase/dihydrofolate synthase [Aquabacterium sp. A7-Y]